MPASAGTATSEDDLPSSEVFALISPSVAFIESVGGFGSGFLVDGGYIVTNYHVIWPSTAVRVVFPDGTELEEVPVVGWDPMAELAVLGPVELSAQPLRLVDGESTPVGSELFLIGYQDEVDHLFPQPTFTRGILSNLREWEWGGITYLQTDHRVAGGLSGGALVNSRGEVIGLFTFLFGEARNGLSASTADIEPILEKLTQGEFASDLGDRRLPESDGSNEFEIKLRNLWDTREFVFEAAEGTTVDIEIEGDSDGRFRVFHFSGLVLLEIDEGYTGVESAEVEITTDGLYFLQVEMASGGEPSTFSVTSSVRLKPLDDPDDGRTIVVGDTIAGSLDSPLDWDWYAIGLQEGDTVKFYADSLNVDTLLYVGPSESEYQEFVSNDDSGGGLYDLNSEIVYRAPHTGEYFIAVTEAVGDQNGGYYLSVETAPEDTPLTADSTPYQDSMSAESETLAGNFYDCITSDGNVRQFFLSHMSEFLGQDGATRDQAQALTQSLIANREFFVSVVGPAIEGGEASEFRDELSEHCEGVRPSRETIAPTDVPGQSDTFGQYFQGETLHVSVVDLEHVPELRYSTIDADQMVRRWSLLPSTPGNELVLVRLKVENHTAESATIKIDGDAAELRDLDRVSYRPLSVSETVRRDFRGSANALIRIDEGHCFDGARALVDVGTTVRWQSEARSEQYLDFGDESIAVGPSGRVELSPGVSISHKFSDPGIYSYVCGESEKEEWSAEIRVVPFGEQDDVVERSVQFLEGSFKLSKGYGLDGYMIFEAPMNKDFNTLHWRADDFITILFDAQTNQGAHAQVPNDLQEYADRNAGYPGAIYVGDINQLVGPAPTAEQGDADGNVPLGALERHLWIYESPLYEELLEKARLTDPTPMTYDGPTITIQHACINRALMPCRLMESYLAPNLLERTGGKLELIIFSFPELGLAGPDTLRLVTDGTLDSATIYAGYVGGEIPHIEIQNLWGIYSSHEQEFEASQAILKDIEELVLAETSGTIMNHNWYAGNDQFLFCRDKLDSLVDFRGKRIRSHSERLSDWIDGMGGEAQFFAFAEVYTALERGILDCGVTGADPAHGQRWYEVTDYMTGPLLSLPFHSNVVSNAVWNSIPADLQQILLEEAAKSELEALRLAAIQNEMGLIRNTTEQGAGRYAMEFVPFSDEMNSHSLNTAVMEHVVPAWVNSVGDTSHPIIADTFNRKLGPIVGLRIEADGTVVRVPITQEPNSGSREMAADFPIIVLQGRDVLGGEQVVMSSIVGHKPVVLDFWAADCLPCLDSLPEFQKFYGKHGGKILMLAVDLGQFTGLGTPEQGRQLLAELGISIPAGYTEDSGVLPKYEILTIPTTVFINADGTIHHKWAGAFNEDVLIENAEEMLAGITIPNKHKVATPTPRGTTDYDADDDGLIEISNLGQLDSMRHDLDGDGVTASSDYTAAFPNALTGMGCPSSGCTGYELADNLDFDTNGNGMADVGDNYWNGGAGWVPLGDEDRKFTANFDGNGNTIANLFIDGDIAYVGLFGIGDSKSNIKGVGLTSVDVSNGSFKTSSATGSLIGLSQGMVVACYATGSVFGIHDVGGLVGANVGTLSSSYAVVNVTGRQYYTGGLVGQNAPSGLILASYATGSVTAQGDHTGGLAGGSNGSSKIIASYATGNVSGRSGDTGGLVGNSWYTTIVNSYATGRVSSFLEGGGGLVGEKTGGEIRDSFWDTQTSGTVDSAGGEGKATRELQTPISDTGIFENWDAGRWDFGTSSQYPVLKYDGLDLTAQ